MSLNVAPSLASAIHTSSEGKTQQQQQQQQQSAGSARTSAQAEHSSLLPTLGNPSHASSSAVAPSHSRGSSMGHSGVFLKPIRSSSPSPTHSRAGSGTFPSALEPMSGAERHRPTRALPGSSENKFGDATQSVVEGKFSEPSQASSKKSSRKSRKRRQKALLKAQVASTLAEIMAALESEKGSQILQLAARVHASKKPLVNDMHANSKEANSESKTSDARSIEVEQLTLKLKRKDASMSLGLTFHTPGRVQSQEIGWDIEQYLIITEIDERDGVKHALRCHDVVVSVDNIPIHTIQDMQAAVAGKKKFKLLVARGGGSANALQEGPVAQAKAEILENIRSTVKAKTKLLLKGDRQNKKNESSNGFQSGGDNRSD